MDIRQSKEYKEFIENKMKEDMLNICDNKISEESAKDYVKEALASINYDLSTLLHKGLAWFAWQVLLGKGIVSY